MKVRLESKQGLEVLADTLDAALDGLQARPPLLPRPRPDVFLLIPPRPLQ